MALVQTIDPTDINIALENAFGERLRWQLDRAEYDARLDEAAYAAAAVLNRPYYEDDLTPEERTAAEQAYREADWSAPTTD